MSSPTKKKHSYNVCVAESWVLGVLSQCLIEYNALKLLIHLMKELPTNNAIKTQTLELTPSCLLFLLAVRECYSVHLYHIVMRTISVSAFVLLQCQVDISISHTTAPCTIKVTFPVE